MCEHCKDGDFGCQNCGTMICFDWAGEDEQAYVTASGDVYCTRCGLRIDAADDEIDYDDDGYYGWDMYPTEWHDPDSNLDLLEDPETPRYIDITIIDPIDADYDDHDA